MTLTDWIGVLAFLLSLFLAGLKVQEWRAKPDLRLDMDWIVGGGGMSTLRIAVGNRGKARGGVGHIVLSPGPKWDRPTGLEYLPHLPLLPAMIEPGAFERFPIEVDPNSTTTLARSLLGGTFTYAILIDQDDSEHPFPIPAQPEDQTIRVSSRGRVSKA